MTQVFGNNNVQCQAICLEPASFAQIAPRLEAVAVLADATYQGLG